MQKSSLAPLLDILAGGPLAVITGAGLSSASGIPAYHDRHGQWRAAQPIRHQDFLASSPARRRYRARSFVGWAKMGDAQPNEGHRATMRKHHAWRRMATPIWSTPPMLHSTYRIAPAAAGDSSPPAAAARLADTALR